MMRTPYLKATVTRARKRKSSVERTTGRGEVKERGAALFNYQLCRN